MPKSVKILVIDEIHLNEAEITQSADPSLKVEIIKNWGLGTKADKNPSLLIHSAREIDPTVIIIGGSHVMGNPKTAEDIYSAAPSLKYLIRAGVGIDHIAERETTNAGIQIFNEPLGNNESTAEWALRMILASLDDHKTLNAISRAELIQIFTVPALEYELALKFRLLKRNHPPALEDRLLKHVDHLLDKNIFKKINQLNNTTIGIMGLGNIGKMFLEKLCLLNQLDTLNINIAAYTTSIDDKTSQFAKSCNCQLLESAKELFQKSSIVTVHIPASEENLRVISSDLLNGSTVHTLVNTSRGQIINYPDIGVHLNKNQAFQLYSDFIPENQDLIEHERVCFIDHLGGITESANRKIWHNVSETLGQIITSLGTVSPNQKPLRNLLNEAPASGWRTQNVKNET